jgi:hypothetical protein
MRSDLQAFISSDCQFQFDFRSNLIFNKREPLFARVKEQVPKRVISEKTSRLPEGKKWDQRDKENCRVAQEARQRAAKVGECLRCSLLSNQSRIASSTI